MYYHNFGDISHRNGPLPASSESAYINTTNASITTARRQHRSDSRAGGLRGRLERILSAATSVRAGDDAETAGFVRSFSPKNQRRKASGKGRPASAGTAAATSKLGGGAQVP
jgi:hypothetical protein